MSRVGWALCVVIGLHVLIVLELSGCYTSITLPGADPNSPAVAQVVFRFPQNGPLVLFAYGSYRFDWNGDWIADNVEVTNASLLTHAMQTIVRSKQDLYLSHVAYFPPIGSLRGGHWTISLSLFGLPGQDKIGEWNCRLPDSSLPYLPPGQSTIVTFQGNDDGTASCTAEPGSPSPV